MRSAKLGCLCLNTGNPNKIQPHVGRQVQCTPVDLRFNIVIDDAQDREIISEYDEISIYSGKIEDGEAGRF